MRRDAAGQKILTRGSGRVSSGPHGSGRVGSGCLSNCFGSGRAGSGLKNSGNFGTKPKFESLIFQIFSRLMAVIASKKRFNAVFNEIDTYKDTLSLKISIKK